MLIRLENITRYFPEVDLFEDVNLQVNEGERIGLVGPNGSGKSQLMGIMAGHVHPDAGRVEYRSRLRIGKLDQEVRADPERGLLEETLRVFQDLMDLEREVARLEETIATLTDQSAAEALLPRYSGMKEQFEREEGYSFRQRAEAVLLGLGFTRDDFSTPCGILSGGQLNRLGLARLLLQKPDLLLLDEPTNHLDLPAIRWLEEFLQSWERSFVIVSHDRYFLDRVVRQIWEISRYTVRSWPGNYSRFQLEKRKRLEQERREYQQQREFIAKNQEFIRRNIYGQKTKQAKSRRKMLEKLDVLDKPTDDLRRISLDLSQAPRSSDTVLVLNHLTVGYGVPLVRFALEMTVVRGDRVGILGENGTGKTTFFRTILGQIPPLDGNFQWGRNVSVGYFDQKMETLTGTPLQEMRLLDPLAAEGDLRGFLARFGFFDDDVFKPLSALSGGEKNRLLLARLIYGRHNVLVLDEPTNHLDIPSREELEEALETFSGSVFVITHDRYFLDRIVSKILFVRDGAAEYFYGNYSEWEARGSRTAPGRDEGDESGRKDKNARERLAPATPFSAERQEEAGLSKNERFRLEKQLVELERRIQEAELQRQEIERVLQSPPASVTAQELTRLSREYESVNRELSGLLEQWEDVGQRLGG